MHIAKNALPATLQLSAVDEIGFIFARVCPINGWLVHSASRFVN